MGGERDLVGNLEQLADLRLGGHQQRRHRRPQALRAQREQQVLHERVDRGAADDALARQLGVGDGEVVQAHPDHQVQRHLGQRCGVLVGAPRCAAARGVGVGVREHLRHPRRRR